MVTDSQRYRSTRGGEENLTFSDVVLKGLAADGGLFLPHAVPKADWQSWKDLSYTELAFEIFRLYIPESEIPSADLKEIINRSYSTFRSEDVVPLKHLDLEGDINLLEIFHGPSYSFKDCALQFLGNLFEYLLAQKNVGKEGKDRYHLTVVGATSGDTGSAAIYGLRGKKDVSVTILHPKGRVSEIQQLQMTTCTEQNVHNLAVTGTFDDCQDIVKKLFGDDETNKEVKLGAVNSINWSRILAQTVFHFWSYFSLARQSDSFTVGQPVRSVTPTGNFGNILSAYFATKMGLPAEKLIVATNENDILHRFWTTGRYEKHPAEEKNDSNAKADVCKETHSPAMDILVSSNFERLLWFLAKEDSESSGKDADAAAKQASEKVVEWYNSLKATGGFGPVSNEILENGRRTFESDRVSNDQTLQTIKSVYQKTGEVLDPHTAVGITVAQRSVARPANSAIPHISLSTAHPAKFAVAVKEALKDEAGFDFEAKVLPDELKALASKETRVLDVENSWEAVREIVKRQTLEDLEAQAHASC